MSGGLKGKVVRGTFWAFLEQAGVQGLNFGMGIVFARLLTRADNGTVALVSVFITVATVLVNSGLGQALVQKREIDELDVNSVFYLSSGIAAVLYGVIFFGAPFAARYYHNPELTAIFRVLALNLLLYAVNSVQNAELYRQMKFNLTFRVSIVTTVSAAAVGIGLAFLGYGVWALVWSSVAGSVAGVIARAIIVAWRPRLMFSWSRLRPLFRYGSKMMANSLIGTIMSNLYAPVIGKRYSPDDLALVNKGRNIPDLLLANVNASLVEVSLPALVQMQDDRERLVRAMRRLMAVSTFVVFPLMLVLAAVSRELVLFFYGEKWLVSVVYMQIACVLMAFGPVGAVNQQGLLAVGRSDIFLKIGIIRNILSALILYVGLAHMSVLAWMFMNALLFGPVSACIDVLFGWRVLGYGVRDQLRDLLPGLFLGAALALPLLLVNIALPPLSEAGLFPVLAAETCAAAVLALGISLAFRLRGACEVASLLRTKVRTDNAIVNWMFRRLEGGASC